MGDGAVNIIRLVIDLYATVLLVRLLLQLVQADFFNPYRRRYLKSLRQSLRHCTKYFQPSADLILRH